METPGQRIRRRREDLGYTHQGLFAKMVGCSQSTLSEIENGFSKKIENLGHAVALHFMFYNFGRIHKTLRVTPALVVFAVPHFTQRTSFVRIEYQTIPQDNVLQTAHGTAARKCLFIVFRTLTHSPS